MTAFYTAPLNHLTISSQLFIHLTAVTALEHSEKEIAEVMMDFSYDFPTAANKLRIHLHTAGAQMNYCFSFSSPQLLKFFFWCFYLEP